MLTCFRRIPISQLPTPAHDARQGYLVGRGRGAAGLSGDVVAHGALCSLRRVKLCAARDAGDCDRPPPGTRETPAPRRERGFRRRSPGGGVTWPSRGSPPTRPLGSGERAGLRRGERGRRCRRVLFVVSLDLRVAAHNLAVEGVLHAGLRPGQRWSFPSCPRRHSRASSYVTALVSSCCVGSSFRHVLVLFTHLASSSVSQPFQPCQPSWLQPSWTSSSSSWLPQPGAATSARMPSSRSRRTV